NTCVLFGDGAGAVVLGEVSEGRGILSFELGTDGAGGKHLYQGKDNFLYMNGREVFKFAVRQMPESAVNVIEKAGYDKEDVDYLIPHQANIRIMEAARARLGISEEKMATTIKKYGNNSSASIPIALSESVKNGKIKDGDLIVMGGCGGGLTWGCIAVRWGRKSSKKVAGRNIGGYKMKDRVVVTGLGAVTPVGNDVPTMWDNLLEGKSGVDLVTKVNRD